VTIPSIPLPSQTTDPLRVPTQQQRISPDQYGAGLGEGLQRLAAGVEKARAEADALAAQEAETRYSREILEKVHGAPDPKTGEFKPGYAGLKGHQALEASSPLAAELAQRREIIASELANDRQRRIFLGRSQAELLGAQRAIESHAGEQVAFLRREGLKTRLEVATQNATAAVATPGGQADLLAATAQVVGMREWLEVAAEQQGLRGDDAERFVREGQGGVASAVMQRLLETPGHSASAKAFLEANRALLGDRAGQFGAAIAKLTDAETLGGNARVEIDRLEREHPGDFGAQLAAAHEIADTKLSDETVQRLHARHVQAERAQADVERQRIGRLRQQIAATGQLDRSSPDFVLLSDDGKADVVERAQAHRRQQRANSAEDRRAQAQANAIARGEWANLDVDEKASLDVRNDRRFAGADEPTLLGLEAQQKKVRLAPPVSVEAFRGRVKTIARDRGMDKAAADHFLAVMEGWYFDETERLRRAPTAKEVREQFAEQLLVLDIPRGRDKPTYQVDEPGLYRPAAPEDQPDADTRELARLRRVPPAAAREAPEAAVRRSAPVRTTAQVPLQARQRIIDDFRAKYGRSPSGADIVAGYNAGVEAGVF
jgi:hypothetical protein